ncbi:MAG: DUF1007 family protein [Yoonia sp.]|nr:DUF1007 family protein [Yoonia sp.]
MIKNFRTFTSSASVAAMCLFASAGATSAHPHLFVGAEVTIIVDSGQPSAIRLDWFYDDFFSLLLTTDLGIDLDGDLSLTTVEMQTLQDAVADWPADFTGDLEVTQNGAPVTLGPKERQSVRYFNGLITETHIRPIVNIPDPDAPIALAVFDPFYYVAYDLRQPINFSGDAECRASVAPADLDAAFALVDSLLGGRDPTDVGVDDEFPAVGAEFADKVTITCAQ